MPIGRSSRTRRTRATASRTYASPIAADFMKTPADAQDLVFDPARAEARFEATAREAIQGERKRLFAKEDVIGMARVA